MQIVYFTPNFPLRANVPFFFGAHECIFTLLVVISQKWCVISRNEQQKAVVNR